MPCPVCNQCGCEDGLCEEHLEECVACDTKIDLETDQYEIGVSLGEYWCISCVGKKKCDYCDEYTDKVRPSPFLGDSASMCRLCWDMTKEEYAASHGEHIGEFEDFPHFK